MDLQQNLNILQILLPLIGAGAILAGFSLFAYIYSKWREKIFLSILFLGLSSFFFVFCEGMIIVLGSILHHIELSRQFHRMEQVSANFFLFSLPYALSYTLTLTPKWRKITRFISYVGLGIAVILTLIAFIHPDLFISISRMNPRGLTDKGAIGRGAEGVLYSIRDAFVGLMIFYNLIITAIDLKINQESRYSLPLFIGIFAAVYGSIDDTLDIYWHYHIDFLPHSNYSRFVLGLIIFVIMAMLSAIRRFLDQAQQVESAFDALNQSEAKFEQIASHIHEVFWLFDISPQDQNKMKLLYVNPAFESIWGMKSHQVYKQHDIWLDVVHPENRAEILDSLQKIHKEPLHLEYPIHISQDKEIYVRDSYFPIYNTKNQLYRIARITEDISEQKLHEQQLTHMAYYDSLTNLPNRKAFMERFSETLEQARRDPNQLRALLFVNLDYFKEINDSLGHSIGDILLQKTTKRIKKCTRKSDYLFRMGGDEFTIILTNLNYGTDAAIVAHKIIESMMEPFEFKGHTIYLGVSIGIALYPRDGENIKTLMKNADTALYQSKKERNTYRFYTQDMQNKAEVKISIITELRQAIKNEEFELFYQPQIALDGSFIGAEALIRWNHPDGGRVPPGKFIPTAEETGLIIPMGKWILETACRDLKKWNPSFNPNWILSINLSAKQFRERGLISFIQQIISQYHIPHETIHLEITESLLVDNLEDTLRRLKILNKQGIKFALDDFGTGYSSLSYLEKLPIHTLKIDRSFILELPYDKKQVALVSAIMQMAEGLDLHVIVEGVEHEEQINFLKTLKFRGGIQGYYYSKPLPMDEFIDFIASRTKN